MNHVDVLMAIKEGRFIPQKVLAGLASQNMPLRLWASTMVSDGDYAKARNHIKEYAQPGSYALMLDNDMILPDGILRAMTEFLDAHDDFAAIALQKRTSKPAGFSEPLVIDERDHVDMSCVLFRSDDLLALTFAYPVYDRSRNQFEYDDDWNRPVSRGRYSPY